MTPAASETRWLTINEVAALLRCDREFVLRQVQAGELPATKVARKWLIGQSDIDRYTRAGYMRPRP